MKTRQAVSGNAPRFPKDNLFAESVKTVPKGARLNQDFFVSYRYVSLSIGDRNRA
jgi:hypothetical protein